jgi:hypothetical protein
VAVFCWDYGSPETKLFFKEKIVLQFCRWYLEELFGLEASPSYPKMKSEAFWRKVAIGMETMALNVFNKSGWNARKRLEF